MPKFNRGERLSGRQSVTDLFQSGAIIYMTPFRLRYLHVEKSSFPASVVISVPKRLFKRAVDRNLLKRRIREAYRLHKPDLHTFLEKNHASIHLAIQYMHQDLLDFHTIHDAMARGMQSLIRELDRNFSE